MNRYESTVRIPIVIKNGRPVPRDGGAFPEFREGVSGELVIPAGFLRSKKVLADLNAREVKDIFTADTRLRVAVDVRTPLPDNLKAYLRDSGATVGSCVEVVLVDDLRLVLRGTKKPVLASCRCLIPALSTEALSLNHAYTLISTEFELWRMSHVGNVFKDVYFKDGQYWLPLGLRRGGQ